MYRAAFAASAVLGTGRLCLSRRTELGLPPLRNGIVFRVAPVHAQVFGAGPAQQAVTRRVRCRATVTCTG